jgi:hypothetical protein
VNHYLAERYLPSHRREGLDDEIERMHAAASARVRLLETLYVPDDEVCFHIFESESPELVQEASRSAGFEVSRVLRVIALTQGGKR